MDVGHGGMDLAVMAGVAGMTEVEVMAALEVLRVEVPGEEDMEVVAPEEGIRKDRIQNTECSSQNAEYFILAPYFCILSSSFYSLS